MSADISNVITVSLNQGGQLAMADNPNVVLIMTSSQNGPLNSTSRYRAYRSPAQVAADWGSVSAETAFADTVLGKNPNPVTGGGYLVIGYWRAASESVAATAASLSGAQLSEAVVVGALQSVSDGAMDITIDGVAENLTALNFQSTTTLDGVAAVIDGALVGADAAIVDQRLVITSKTTGATSTITFATAPVGGTFIGDILALTTGSGAFLAQGAAADTLAAETKVEAITELFSQVKFRGDMFIDKPTDAEAKALAVWGQANDVLQYDVFSSPTNLAVDPSNVVWDIKLSGLSNYRMLYSKTGNRKLAAAYMARTHTVNFAAENSAITMQYKELSVLPEDEYGQTEIDSAKTVGLDLYTTVKEVPVMLTSGANVFTDERYNLIAYVDQLEIDVFNLLKSTSTKISQTTADIAKIVDQCEKTTRQYRRANVIGAGEWTSPDTFGNVDVFKRNIRENGFYWLAGSLADQSQASRENRESPVIQGAIKLSGATHTADIIVNVNR